jgi:hypothetical protein
MVVNVHIGTICINQPLSSKVEREIEQIVAQALAQRISPGHPFQPMTERRVTLSVPPGLSVEESVLRCLEEALGVE